MDDDEHLQILKSDFRTAAIRPNPPCCKSCESKKLMFIFSLSPKTLFN